MIEITAEVRAAIDRAAGDMELAGDEYIEPTDGLIHCKKCRGSRQTLPTQGFITAYWNGVRRFFFSGKNFREEGARATKAAAKEIVRK